MSWTLLTLVAVGGPVDPRIEIVEARLSGRPGAALEIVERALQADPERGHELGFDYLRGDLLETLNRPHDADSAFAAAMAGHEQLSAYGRYRLAFNQSRRGHPEVTAGLLATLLANNPPPPLAHRAARLFTQSLSLGGDCRLLRDLAAWPLTGEPRRLLEVTAVDCARSVDQDEASKERLLRLLEESVVDEPARLAAERLDRRFGSKLTSRKDLLLVGSTFHYQRQFELAVRYLERGLAIPLNPGEDSAESLEARYALARSRFWLADYQQAVQEFGRVAANSSRSEDVARALYQQARSYELNGSLSAATNSFRQAYLEDPDGRWSAAALLSTLRLEWRGGREDEALALLNVLSSRKSWGELYGRATLFLASSDLVQNRTDRAEQWLLAARQARRTLRPLVHYWTGRLEQQRDNDEAAAASYLEAMADAPFSPLAQFARTRLESPELEAAAGALAKRLSEASDSTSLAKARLLLGDGPAGQGTVDKAMARLGRSAAAEPFLRLDFIEPAAWPLWEARLSRPEDLLLALGIWQEGESAARRHFPSTNISLAYTGSQLLSRHGAHRSALRMSEIVYEGARARIPENLIPTPLRRAVFPLPYGTLIAEYAARHKVDPYLLTALIREESRFDSSAVSAASARGLTQFVLSTARRLAPRAGLDSVSAEDLHKPEVSIALGAAYLDELLERFEGREHQAVAAYNAGENQAELWLNYCFTMEPEEYLTKVGFPETRSYLSKVLGSRAQYADLYAPETFALD
jgi:soluble lytic murein transglycosylase-like protein/TolA-binding protein